MSVDVQFEPAVFESLIGGRAVIDSARLNVKSVAEAVEYLKTYGYDLEVEADREKLWQIHSRAVVYLRTQLLMEGETLPEEISDRNRLGDISQLLVVASQSGPGTAIRMWACALLRVMHVISQLQNDLFNYFSLEIQEEIFRPYRHFVNKDPVTGIHLTAGAGGESVPLHKFDIKPFKDSDSAVTKLLAKADEVAFGLLDKIGVRFVTTTLFDVFRVMRFLVDNHVISPANIIPSQSNNTLYPVDLFFEVVRNPPGDLTAESIDRALHDRLERAAASARYLEKPNTFTSRDYRFVKFITRQLVRVTVPESHKAFTFFYPYEVQILDHEHYLRTLSGPASHEEYKARQKVSARQRILV